MFPATLGGGIAIGISGGIFLLLKFFSPHAFSCLLFVVLSGKLVTPVFIVFLPVPQLLNVNVYLPSINGAALFVDVLDLDIITHHRFQVRHGKYASLLCQDSGLTDVDSEYDVSKINCDQSVFGNFF